MNKSKVFATTQFVFIFSIPHLRTRSHSQSCSLAPQCSGFRCSLHFAEPKAGQRRPGRRQTHENRETKQSSRLPALNLPTQNFTPGSWAPIINSWRSSTLGCVSVSSPTTTQDLTQSPLRQLREESLASRNNLDGVQPGRKGKKSCATIRQAFLWEKINTKCHLFPPLFPSPPPGRLAPKEKSD